MHFSLLESYTADLKLLQKLHYTLFVSLFSIIPCYFKNLKIPYFFNVYELHINVLELIFNVSALQLL